MVSAIEDEDKESLRSSATVQGDLHGIMYGYGCR